MSSVGTIKQNQSAIRSSADASEQKSIEDVIQV
jgi:hypothetical protein